MKSVLFVQPIDLVANLRRPFVILFADRLLQFFSEPEKRRIRPSALVVRRTTSVLRRSVDVFKERSQFGLEGAIIVGASETPSRAELRERYLADGTDTLGNRRRGGDALSFFEGMKSIFPGFFFAKEK